MHGITSYQNVELRFVLPLHYTPTSPKRTLLSERPEVVSATHSTGITPSQRAQSVSQLSSNVARQESPTHLRKRKNREKPAVVPTENCQDEVKKALRPILRPDDTDSCYVLLCRGKPMDCLIQPVKIPNTADEEQTWKLINAAWYELRGKWTRHVPFFGVKAIDVVQVGYDPVLETCPPRDSLTCCNRSQSRDCLNPTTEIPKNSSYRIPFVAYTPNKTFPQKRKDFKKMFELVSPGYLLLL